MAKNAFESRVIDEVTFQDFTVIKHEVQVDDYTFMAARYSDWFNRVYWPMPEEYGLEDFLRVVEDTFELAEANGYVFLENPELEVALAFNGIAGSVVTKFERPLTLEDLLESDADIDMLPFVKFFKTRTQLADFRCHPGQLLAVDFMDKPHHKRTAFHFMAELMPSRLRLDPIELGSFIMGLEIPDEPSSEMFPRV